MSLGQANRAFVCVISGSDGGTVEETANQWLRGLPDTIELVQVQQSCFTLGRDHDKAETVLTLICRKNGARHERNPG
jgi:hypothetical protein